MQLTTEEIKAILSRELVAASTGVLDADKDKVRLCCSLLDILGETYDEEAVERAIKS